MRKWWEKKEIEWETFVPIDASDTYVLPAGTGFFDLPTKGIKLQLCTEGGWVTVKTDDCQYATYFSDGVNVRISNEGPEAELVKFSFME